MKKILIFSLFVLFSFASCKKDTDTNSTTITQKDCERNFTGTLVVRCTSSNPYEYYINGTYKGIIDGGQSKTLTLSQGSYEIYYVQKSGYVLYPTTGTKYRDVVKCAQVDADIPN